MNTSLHICYTITHKGYLQLPFFSPCNFFFWIKILDPSLLCFWLHLLEKNDAKLRESCCQGKVFCLISICLYQKKLVISMFVSTSCSIIGNDLSWSQVKTKCQKFFFAFYIFRKYMSATHFQAYKIISWTGQSGMRQKSLKLKEKSDSI